MLHISAYNVDYSSLPNKRPGVAYSFFEKNPGGTLLLGWGRLFIFHGNFRGVDYLGGVADILGLLRHIFDILVLSGCRGSSIFYDSFLGGRLFEWGR